MARRWQARSTMARTPISSSSTSHSISLQKPPASASPSKRSACTRSRATRSRASSSFTTANIESTPAQNVAHVTSSLSFKQETAMSKTNQSKAWVARGPKQPMVLEPADLGPLGAEDVEVAVEHCGLCHSDVSILNNEWGFSQYPAVLGHEVIGRITAVGSNTKARKVGQRVGVG